MGVSIRGRQSGPSPAAGYGAWLDLIKVAARGWLAAKAPRLGAAVAFYSMPSLAPLLIITVAVIGLAFGEGTARAQIVAQARALIGPQGAEAVAAMIEHARKPGAGILASILGVTTLLFGASGVFGELKDALNTIWEVEPPPGVGVWGFVRDRTLSFAMVLLIWRQNGSQRRSRNPTAISGTDHLATLLVLSLGAWVLKTGRRSFLEATRRRLLSLFQLGLRWLRYALDHDQPLPCRLYLYPQ